MNHDEAFDLNGNIWLLELLPEREKKIISLRYGLNGGKPKTLKEVAKELGVSRNRIVVKQKEALAKMRRTWISKNALEACGIKSKICLT